MAGISADINAPLTGTDFSSVTDYQIAIGDYVECITMGEAGATLFCDEDGKEKQLAINWRATAHWCLFEPAIRGHDAIVGDVVLVERNCSSIELQRKGLPTALCI